MSTSCVKSVTLIFILSTLRNKLRSSSLLANLLKYALLDPGGIQWDFGGAEMSTETGVLCKLCQLYGSQLRDMQIQHWLGVTVVRPIEDQIFVWDVQCSGHIRQVICKW